MNKCSFLIIALILGTGAVTSCASVETKINSKADSGAAHNNSAANGKVKHADKPTENISTETEQTKSIELFDGRSGKVKNNKLSEVDLALVESDVRKKSGEDFLKKQLGDLGKNVDWKEEFKILDVAEGAFTEPDSIQRAVLYRFSYTNGLVILADGDIVAHYSGGPGDYAFYTAIKALPDVNRNGLSEIVLFRNVEDNEDIIPYLFESQGGKIKFLGEGNYFSSSYAAGDDTDSKNAKQKAYRLIVFPSQNPTYFQEIYERTGSKGNWKLTEQAEKFSWNISRIAESIYDLVKI